jgi:hypothetical protein
MKLPVPSTEVVEPFVRKVVDQVRGVRARGRCRLSERSHGTILLAVRAGSGHPCNLSLYTGRRESDRVAIAVG